MTVTVHHSAGTVTVPDAAALDPSLVAGLLPTPHAAKRIGLSANTLSRYARCGLIVPAVVVEASGARWYRRSDVDGLYARLVKGHGPECPRSGDPFGRGSRECHCVACWCAEDHVPGGFLGTCQRCGRKRRQDLRTSARKAAA